MGKNQALFIHTEASSYDPTTTISLIHTHQHEDVVHVQIMNSNHTTSNAANASASKKRERIQTSTSYILHPPNLTSLRPNSPDLNRVQCLKGQVTDIEYVRDYCRSLQRIYSAVNWYGADALEEADSKGNQRYVYVYLQRDACSKMMKDMLQKMWRQWVVEEDGNGVDVVFKLLVEKKGGSKCGNGSNHVVLSNINDKEQEVMKELSVEIENELIGSPQKFERSCQIRLLNSVEGNLDDVSYVVECNVSFPSGSTLSKCPAYFDHVCLVPMVSCRADGFVVQDKAMMQSVDCSISSLLSLMLGTSSHLILTYREPCKDRIFLATATPNRRLLIKEMTEGEAESVLKGRSIADSFTPFLSLLLPKMSHLAQLTSSGSNSFQVKEKPAQNKTLAYAKASNSVAAFQACYKSCILKNDPTPALFVRTILPESFFNLFRNDYRLLHKHKIYLTSKRLRKKKYDPEVYVRTVQVQAMMRCEIFAITRKEPLEMLLARKQKKQDRNNYTFFVDEISTLLSSAIFHMSPETFATSFMEQTLVKTYFKAYPKLILSIYKKFEIMHVLPNENRGFILASESRKKEARPMQKKITHKPKSVLTQSTSLASNNGLVNTGKDGAPAKKKCKTGFYSSVNLATRTKTSNPMLVNGRKKYIGGHFIDKLSNASDLFREMKSFKIVQKENVEKKSNKMLSKNSKMHARFIEPHKNLSFVTSPRKRKKGLPTKLTKVSRNIVGETPVKCRVKVASTPDKSPIPRSFSTRSIIDEVALSRAKRKESRYIRWNQTEQLNKRSNRGNWPS